MLENLRKDSAADFVPPEEPVEATTIPLIKDLPPRRSVDQVTKTTAIQRLILACMLLLTVCLMGFLLLILTGKIVPSFLF